MFALTEKEDLCQGYSVEKATKFAAGHKQTVSEENGSMCPLLNYLQLLHFDVKLFDFSDFLQLLIRSAFHLTLCHLLEANSSLNWPLSVCAADGRYLFCACCEA